MLTVEAPPARICFSASSHAAAPLLISYLETGNQLLFCDSRRRDAVCEGRDTEYFGWVNLLVQWQGIN